MSDSSPTPRKARRSRWRRFLIVFAALLVVLGAAEYTPDLPREQLEAKYAPAPSKFLTLPSGARVHYRDQGKGGLLVLLHGSLSSLHTWEPWVAALSAEHRVVTLDL